MNPDTHPVEHRQRFAVIGAGALGSIVAAHLARADQPVVLVARGRRAAQIEADGITLTGLDEFKAQVPVLRPGDIEARRIAADVVVLCVKAFDTVQALTPLGFVGRPLALSLQNGVLKNEELLQHFGVDRVLGAAASVAGEVLADGRTRFTMNQRLALGELAGGRSDRADAVAAMLRRAGIAAEAVDNIRAVEWTKYASFVPLFAAGLLTRQPTWRCLAEPAAAAGVLRLMREVVALATASGVAVQDPPGLSPARIAAAPDDEALALLQRFGETMRANAPQHRVSALQDLQRGGRLEVDAILGHAAQLGRQLGVPVPAVDICHALCSLLDPASDRPA